MCHTSIYKHLSLSLSLWQVLWGQMLLHLFMPQAEAAAAVSCFAAHICSSASDYKQKEEAATIHPSAGEFTGHQFQHNPVCLVPRITNSTAQGRKMLLAFLSVYL